MATITQPKVGMCAVLSIQGHAVLVKFCKKLDYQLPRTPPPFPHSPHATVKDSTGRAHHDKMEKGSSNDDHARPTVLYLSPNAPHADDLILGSYFTLFVGRLHFLVQIIDLLHEDRQTAVLPPTKPQAQTTAASSRRTLEDSTSHLSSVTPIASGLPRLAQPSKPLPTPPPLPRTYLDGLPAIPSEDGNASLRIIPSEHLPLFPEAEYHNLTRDDVKPSPKATPNAEAKFAVKHPRPPYPVRIQIDPCPRIDDRRPAGHSHDMLHPTFDFLVKLPVQSHRSPSASSTATRKIGSEGSSTNLPRSVRSRKAAAVDKKKVIPEHSIGLASAPARLPSTTAFDSQDGITFARRMTNGQAVLKRKELQPLLPRRKAPPPVVGEDSEPSRTSRRITSSRTVPVAEVIKSNLFPSPRPSLEPCPNPPAEPIVEAYRPSREALELRLSKTKEKKGVPPNRPVAGGPSLSLERMEVVGYRAVPLGRF